jgi:hypothetical protein
LYTAQQQQKSSGGLLLLLLLLHPDQRRAVVFSFDGWNRTRAASENRRRFAQAPVRLSFANCPATKNQGYINSASILQYDWSPGQFIYISPAII